MKTIFIVIMFSGVLSFKSCISSSRIKTNRELLKEYAYCKCLQYSSFDTSFLKNDISIGVYRDIANYYFDAFNLVDSFSKKVAVSIMPSIIPDHNGKKAVLQDCFIFYKSKLLDSLVKKLDKRSFKGW